MSKSSNLTFVGHSGDAGIDITTNSNAVNGVSSVHSITKVTGITSNLNAANGVDSIIKVTGITENSNAGRDFDMTGNVNLNNNNVTKMVIENGAKLGFNSIESAIKDGYTFQIIMKPNSILNFKGKDALEEIFGGDKIEVITEADVEVKFLGDDSYSLVTESSDNNNNI